MSGERPPTLAELVVMLRDLPEGPERAFLEDAYWAKAEDHHGLYAGWSRAKNYRWEYEWLRRERHRRRLEEMLPRPALGAFLEPREAG